MHTIFHVIVDFGNTYTFLNYADALAFIDDGEHGKMDERYFVMVPSIVDQETYDKIRRLADADPSGDSRDVEMHS